MYGGAGLAGKWKVAFAYFRNAKRLIAGRRADCRGIHKDSTISLPTGT
jgi:hypothetical protein